jgi:hypothetical protein
MFNSDENQRNCETPEYRALLRGYNALLARHSQIKTAPSVDLRDKWAMLFAEKRLGSDIDSYREEGLASLLRLAYVYADIAIRSRTKAGPPPEDGREVVMTVPSTGEKVTYRLPGPVTEYIHWLMTAAPDTDGQRKQEAIRVLGNFRPSNGESAADHA